MVTCETIQPFLPYIIFATSCTFLKVKLKYLIEIVWGSSYNLLCKEFCGCNNPSVGAITHYLRPTTTNCHTMWVDMAVRDSNKRNSILVRLLIASQSPVEEGIDRSTKLEAQNYSIICHHIIQHMEIKWNWLMSLHRTMWGQIML